MDLRSCSRALYYRFERALVPGLRHSQSLYAETLPDYVAPGTRWLDLGCGHRILRKQHQDLERELVDRCRMVVGIDYDFPSLQKHQTIRHRVRGDIGRLPFADATFDVVTANMVVEHLTHPEPQFAEIRRVLKPDGLFVFHTPNAWGYYVLLARMIPEVIKPKLVYLLEGRREEDVFPTHYRANTPPRITALAEATGFTVERLRLVVSTGHYPLALLPPLSWAQLLWTRLLMTQRLKPLRTYIIAVLRKHDARPVG